MKKNAIAIVMLAASFMMVTGCKKDKDMETCSCPAPVTSSNPYHFPLTIGSYWIYESDNMDSSFHITSVAAIDSVFIANDTTINGKQYAQKKVITFGGGSDFIIASLGYPSISRDSAGYLVSPSGTFIKDDDFTDILNVKTYTSPLPPYTIVSRMANKDSSVTVPAGTFTTINYLGKITIMDPAFTGTRVKYNYDIMAPNVGDIYKTAGFYYTPVNIGIRLLRYHIAG